MERNPTDDMGTSNASTGASQTTSTDSTQGIATGTSQDASLNASSNTSSSTSAGLDDASIGDRLDQARSTVNDRLGEAREMASERLGQAREKATQLKATLADRLEASASSLRERAQGMHAQPQYAGATAGGAASGLLNSDQIQRLAGPAADAMQKTADFLRDGDLKETLEEQVRTNPARTLLIAVGVGYLLGKALRR